MAERNQIQYLTHQQIDKDKWDKCIANAPNGLIYAYSFYLDIMARQWGALVLNDYEIVMPLPWKNKYGINYLYQPAFTASLGVFGKTLNEKIISDFLREVPLQFKFIELSLNAANKVTPPHGSSTLRVNYILDLNKSYNLLSAAYRENHLRNIKKTFSSGCTVKKDIPVEEIIRINQEQMSRINALSNTAYENFKKLFYLLKEKRQAETYAIVNQQNVIMASCVFFYSHNRAYYILVGNTPDGKTMGASHALIDAFIKDNAGKEIILDFEGSDIRNLAFFYSGFGAKEELYPYLKINRLPFYLKWLKK
jgi:hypothetical protein